MVRCDEARQLRRRLQVRLGSDALRPGYRDVAPATSAPVFEPLTRDNAHVGARGDYLQTAFSTRKDFGPLWGRSGRFSGFVEVLERPDSPRDHLTRIRGL